MPQLALGVSSLADALTVISVELGEGHFLIQEAGGRASEICHVMCAN